MDYDESWAIRWAGSPLFSVSGQPVYDLAQFCTQHNLSAEARSQLIEDLMVHGQADLNGSAIELVDAQELARQIEG